VKESNKQHRQHSAERLTDLTVSARSLQAVARVPIPNVLSPQHNGRIVPVVLFFQNKVEALFNDAI
jgi:hypothetical protein